MLDTHAAVKELTKAGLSEDAAEAIVQVQLRTPTRAWPQKKTYTGPLLRLKKS
jgi:hypothetical protein